MSESLSCSRVEWLSYLFAINCHPYCDIQLRISLYKNWRHKGTGVSKNCAAKVHQLLNYLILASRRSFNIRHDDINRRPTQAYMRVWITVMKWAMLLGRAWLVRTLLDRAAHDILVLHTPFPEDTFWGLNRNLLLALSYSLKHDALSQPILPDPHCQLCSGATHNFESRFQ